MNWKQTLILILAALAGITWYTTGKFQDAMEQKKQSGPLIRNVYLITATGVPADHLSSYLYQPIQTTFLDYLAYDGVRFTNAFSTSTISFAAHISILTGRYPFRDSFQLSEDGEPFVDSGSVAEQSLPRWLQKSGYKTAFISEDPDLRNFVLNSRFFQETLNIADIQPPDQPSYHGNEVLQTASKWIDQNRRKKHFLWVNFNEPQLPFEPPAPFKDHYAAHPFDGEIAAVDALIGKLVHRLKQTGLYQNSIVIFTSPFAESPSGSGRIGSVQDQYLQVPLLISAPGLLPRQQMYESMVSLVDLPPTIAGLMEQKLPFNTDGTALFVKGSTDEIKREFIFGQSWNQQNEAVYFARTNQWKLIIGTEEILFRNPDRAVSNQTTETETMRKKLRDQMIAKGIVQQEKP